MTATFSISLLQLLVKENDRIREKIPELLVTLMGPHMERVDEVISPGLTVLRWTSLNLDAFVKSSHDALKSFELLIDRVNGIHESRIKLVLRDILGVPLCEMPSNETITVTEFISSTSQLCAEAGTIIDTKSHIAEKAVIELTDMLLGPAEQLEEPEDETAPGAIATLRKIERNTKLRQEADILFQIYEQQNVDTLVQLIRMALESIRKRVSIAHLTYVEFNPSGSKHDHPLFQGDIVLCLPSLVMKPTLDEVQQGLNKAVQFITSVTKEVYRWGQQRDDSVTSIPASLPSQSDIRSRSRIQLKHVRYDPSMLKNYYRTVYENKEVAKLVSLLSSAINSTKTLVTQGIDHFSKYKNLWAIDRDEHMQEYLEGSPGVNEFQSEMQHYAYLEEVILTEPDTIPAGAIALSSEGLKITLCAEAKSWRVCYGRAMIHKYETVMDEVFTSIDDWGKRLSRPLKDLDDIRSVMATLKEIRENEIRIDMSLGPIEVNVLPASTTVSKQNGLHSYKKAYIPSYM